MPENKSRLEFQNILGQILKNTFEINDLESMSDLLKECDSIEYSRESTNK